MQASAQLADPVAPRSPEWVGQSQYDAADWTDAFDAVLRDLAENLADRLDLQVSHTGDALLIMPTGAEGFPITIARDSRSIWADFGGCRQDFEAVSQVRYCVKKILSGDCRLRIDYRNGQPRHWTLEDTSRGGARALISVGYPSYSFWPFGPRITSRHFSYRIQG